MSLKEKLRITNTDELIALIVIGLLAITALITFWHRIPNNDSGVFLYAGKQILHGGIPYLDFWDHKPPAIFYINAFGLLIGRGSMLGVLFLQFLLLLISGFLGYFMLKRNFGIFASFFGSTLWLINFIAISNGGNFTEVWGLPLQFVALYLFSYERLPKMYLKYFLIGLISASLFLLQPNLIGIPISIVILLFIWRYPVDNLTMTFKYILTIIIGSLSLLIVVIIYFVINNAFNNLLDAVVDYGLYYSAGSYIYKTFVTIYSGVNYLPGIVVFSIVSWVFGALYIINNKKLCVFKSKMLNRDMILVYLAVIDLPIEIFLSIIPGRNAPQYYITWLPALSILVAYFVYTFLAFCNSSHSERLLTNNKNIRILFIFLIMVSSCAIPISHVAHDIYYTIDDFSTSDEIVEFIDNQTSKDDFVLIWGVDPYWNFLTSRESPTKFSYQLPLFTKGYTNIKLINEFYNDIMKNEPALIIDAHASWVPPIDPTKRAYWVPTDPHYGLSKDMDGFFKYLESNYEYIGSLRNGYDVYRNRDLHREP